jgi:hypothetical protein
LEPATVSLFYVNYPANADLLCARSPDTEVCQSIQDNCRAIGGAIFCDMALAIRLKTTADVAYSVMHASALVAAGMTEEPILLTPNLSIDRFREFAQLHEHLQAADDPRAAIPESTAKFVRYAMRFPSKTEALMVYGLQAMLLGHEYNHVEQEVCIKDAASLSIDGAALLGAYFKLSCTIDPDQLQELMADFRGLDLTLITLALASESITERPTGIAIGGITESRELRAVQLLDKRFAIGLVQAVTWFEEYDALFNRLGTNAWELVRGEPSDGNVGAYWYAKTLESWRMSSLSRTGYGKTHIPRSLRSLMLLSMIEARSQGVFDRAPPSPGERLQAAARADAVGMQMAYCGRTEQQALDGWHQFEIALANSPRYLPPPLQHLLGGGK